MSFKHCYFINELMSDFNKIWFVVGGWAIDLHIGKETRLHKDIEISVFRKDQLKLKEYLQEWEFQKVIKGEFHPWKNEYLELPIHEIHAINKLSGAKMEILLNETCGNKWIFRRDMRISYPIKELYRYSVQGIPYLNPEIVLLYKVRNTREKDHQDFMTVKDYLNDHQRKWLSEAIQIHEPQHEWLKCLG
ncbi:hypothetical protein GCM10008986_29930 [Salinibacillus aidingensis]|uniref:Aminoglycoside-2''-adenylyltransferase n=1 Tax=Salinibacillus aidingensis TaxID=237684 RepID=A0ABN1BLJ2_9BACI